MAGETCPECGGSIHDPLCPVLLRSLNKTSGVLIRMVTEQFRMAVPALARGYLKVLEAVVQDAWERRKEQR